jgi:hypothetical protein
MKTRDDLLREIHAEQAAWQALLDEVGEDRMEEPGPMGDWTFKDLTAHLTAWQDRMIERFAAAPNSNPPTAWPASLQSDDEINAWIYEQHRERSLHDVLAGMDQSYQRLANLIEAMPEEALMTPGHFDVLSDKTLAEADFFGHLHEEHEPSIREWLQSR